MYIDLENGLTSQGAYATKSLVRTAQMDFKFCAPGDRKRSDNGYKCAERDPRFS